MLLVLPTQTVVGEAFKMIQIELNIMNIMNTVFGNQTDGQKEKNEIRSFLVFEM